MFRIAMAVVTGTFLWASCEGDTSPPSNLDPDATPVPAGTWYRPPVDATWQWQLQGVVNTSYDVDVYDVDLFDVPDATLRQITSNGARVICYFSAGTAEDWREDFDQFLATDLGSPVAGWPGEWWVDVRSQNVLDIMLARLDRAAERGCDGVEPDNVDGYTNASGFPLSSDDQLAYNKAIANAARSRGLAVGLKNDVDQVRALVDFYDFALNEECHTYDECATEQPFLDAQKPVFNAEYADSAAEAQGVAAAVCPSSRAQGLATLVLPWDLDDAFRVSCD